ncbi:MAG: polysaccharide biosynthesis tyrosine autokinase [Cyanobacteria bacterium J06621_15]
MNNSIKSILTVCRRRSLPAIATFTAVMAGAVYYLAVTPRVYQTSARLMLDNKLASVSELGRDLTQSSRNSISSNPLADQAELVKSQAVLARAIAEVSSEDELLSPQTIPKPKNIGENLQVKILPATNILELNYQNQNPVLAKDLLNAVARSVVEENIITIKAEASKIKEFLEKYELPGASKRLTEAETAEKRYRGESGIVSFEEQSKSLVESLASVEEQQRNLLIQLQEARSQEASLQEITQTRNPTNAYAAVRSGQNEELKKLRAKLADLEQQLTEIRSRFTESHPALISLIQQRDATKRLYEQELAEVSSGNETVITDNNIAGEQLSQNLASQLIANRIQKSAIENKLKVVQNELANLQKRLAELPVKQQKLATIIRKRKEAESSLKFLQNKLEEARIAEAQKISNIRIVEAATVPTSPASPKPAVVLVLATVFGSILATGVVLMLEVMDNTLKNAPEIEELLEVPLLGVLPPLPNNKLRLRSAEIFLENFSLLEPYRSLLKVLEIKDVGKPRVIVVSSTSSGEGKSVVASHLAAVSAMLSRRTLIIDANLRKPIQHKVFDIESTQGITDVIDGRKSLLEAVQPTNIDCLHLLTCSKQHQRSSQLLESAKIATILREAANKYDLVIIDTNSLSDSPDAAILSKNSDGLIIVTRPDFTRKELLQKTVSELSKSRVPVLGVVVNDQTTSAKERHYYSWSINNYESIGNLTAAQSEANNTANTVNGLRAN